MAILKSKSKPLGKGDRVVVVRDLPGIPEGSTGRIEMVVGLTWVRYWIQFDTGEWVGSIDAGAVVAEDDWPDYQRRRAEEAERAAEEARNPPPPAAEAPAAANGDGGGGGGGPASRIPAHILERSKAARERLPKA